MKNAFRVLKRDLLRLLKSPAALTVVIVLIILPSLYTWFNVAGFWNPYDNTSNLRVCVVNEDQGASSDLAGDLDMGAQVVDALEENDQLGWVFTDRETAMEEVRSGTAYAAFIIPADFSRDVTGLFEGDYARPQLKYYVNEKAGAVSPKITDAGATTLDETINSTFVSTVSGVVADRLDEAFAEADADIDAAQTSVARQLGVAKESMDGARAAVSDLQGATDGVSAKASDAKAALGDARETIATLSDQIEKTSDLVTATQADLGPFTVSLMSTLDQSSVLVSSVSNKTATSVGQAQGAIVAAQGTVDGAVAQGQVAVAQNEIIIAQLNDLAQSLPDGDEKALVQSTISLLTAQNDSLRQALSGLDATSDSLAAASTDVSAATDKVNGAVQGTLSGIDGYRSTLATETFPALNSGTAALAGATADLSTAISNQQIIIDQADEALDQLVVALDATSTALGQTDGLLAGFSSDLDAVQTDLAALDTSGALADLFGGDLNVESIAEFMGSPTELQTEELYSVNAYGSAMAPLFMNLTLWIGVFMLLVILRQEVDDEGIPNLTTGQRYVGKWLFLAPITALQAIVCCVGNLALGVQVASVPLFFLTAVMTSLTYLCIQYALAVLLLHVGKGLCIILIFMQIPGATGLYPIEMTPSFFQSVYPAFPFTYGINALRETIAGFYGTQLASYLGVLAVFALAFFFVGLKLRPYLTNLHRMFSRQIRESDILNGEEVELPARRYRMTHLFRLMADRQEFRDELDSSVRRFFGWYPRAQRLFPVIAIVVPVIVTAVLSWMGVDKVIILTVWLAWLVTCIFVLIVIEFVRDRFEHELSLGSLNDDEVRQLFHARDGRSDAPAPQPTKIEGRPGR